MAWKLPPKIKILEALAAVADGRVTEIKPNIAKVKSSSGERYYTVRYFPERNEIESDDNGSVYRGYLGYPAIAFLMLKGILPYDEVLASKLKGINWKKLVETTGNYEKAIEKITAKWTPHERQRLEKYCKWILSLLSELKLSKPRVREQTLSAFINP